MISSPLQTGSPRQKLIVALDVADAAAAREIVAELAGNVGAFKVGLQLFTAAGPEFVRELCDAGHRIFLDLKFHDIPNTTAMAAVSAVRLGVWMFNVHASGGSEMMKRTAAAISEMCIKENLRRPIAIGVTVLTSSGDDTICELGLTGSPEENVMRLAALAEASGLDGVVASGLEAPAIRRTCGDKFLIVTPGIRAISATNDDQRRVMTAADAISAGADYIVVGRPITEAHDRAAAAADILESIERSI